MARTFLKIILWIVGIIVGLFLLVWIVIQIPSVQNAIADKLTQSLSRTLKTEVSLDRVNIRFIKTIVLEGVYIESLQNDTLLYARKLGVNIGLLDLFDNRIHVRDITLDGAYIQLQRAEMDSVFNYQFLLDAFATAPDTTAAQTVWTFDVDDVAITDSRFRMLDTYAGTDMEARIDNFALNVNEIDMENQSVDINSIQLDNSMIAYRILKNYKPRPAPEPSPDSSLIVKNDTIAFPSTGWSLALEQLRLQNNQIIYENETEPLVANAMDFNHLNIQNLNISVNNVAWREKVIQADIDNIAFKDRSGFELKSLATELEMNERQIAIRDFKFKTPESFFDASTTLSYSNFSDFVKNATNNARLDVDIKDSRLAFQDLKYFAPSITEIKQLNTQLVKDINFSGRVVGTLSNLETIEADLNVGNDLRVRLNGSARNVTDTENLSYNINLQEATTSYNQLKRLTRGVAIPAGLKTFGRVQLSGLFQGNLKTINASNVNLKTDAYTGFQGDIQAQNLTDVNNLKFQVNVRDLRTQAKDLNGFVAGGLPVQVKNLGRIRYVGKLSGTTTEFDIDGNLVTDAGTVNTDLYLDFNKNYTNASYNGKVNLNQFNLGKVLQDTSIGRMTLNMSVKGSGLSPQQINAKLNGNVAALEFNRYTYKNFRIDGAINKQQFIGKANIKDPNITFAFDGNVNFNDTFPRFTFVADVDTVNLQKLNFYATPLSLSANIDADFRGLNIDDLDGTARIQNLAISNDTISYKTNSIVLTASTPDTTGKLLKLQSDFLNAQISGNYKLADLPKLVQNFVNDYFPLDQFISPVDTPTELALEPQQPRVIADQDFEALIELQNPVPLLKLFVAGMEKLDTAFVSVRMDTKARDLEILGGVPQLVFGGRSYNNIRLEGKGTPERLNANFSVEDVEYGAVNPISLATLTVDIGNDSLNFNVLAQEGEGDTTRTKLSLAANASRINDMYRLIFAPNFVLNNETWQITQGNEILYKTNYLDINNFALQKDGQSIAISTADSPNDQDFAPLSVTFEKFQIKEIFDLMNMSEDKYSGEVNGTATLRDYGKNLNYMVDMSINNIALNEQPVGNLIIKAEPEGQQTVRINVALQGEQSNATVAGTYGIANGGLNLDANLQNLELRLADPFASGFITDSEGSFSGNFTIRGTTTNPDLNGNVRLNNISTLVKMANVRYTIPQGNIAINDQTLDLGRMPILDDRDNEAVLSGRINYANLSNIGLDLNFNTDRFQLLNTESQGDALYYGKLVVAADVDIKGTTTAPRINVKASTLDSSQLFIQPLTAQEAIASQEDYIIFANPATFTPADTMKGDYQVNRSAIDLVLNLEVTPETELQIIIDPATGDKLVCRGTANLAINMNPQTAMSITGNYEMESGSYSLNYQGLLKRNFSIRQGSRLDFIGDPLKTRFNVAALYTTRTPTYELVRNQVTALTPDQERKAKQRSPVTVVLAMRGDLANPLITFDIQLGEEAGDQVTSVEAQTLARLRDNPTELNTQVFSLLLFNSFLSQQSGGGGGLAGAGTSVALSSVSALLTNQLNNLADRLVKGVDIEVGVESYESAYDQGTITELNLGVSKQLFNDRLTVQVGGNVNVNSENALLVQGANFSQIAGDFQLEYRLTDDGNYRLRVFRRESVDVLNQNNNPQTGVGVTFRKSYGQKEKERSEGKPKKGKAKKVKNTDVILPDEQYKIDKDDE